jgi:hypothetical protein
MAGRASETAEQSDDWLAACVRSLNDESDGFGLEPEQIAALHKPDPQIAIRHVPPFAEPGEMAMRERDEVSQDTGTRPIGIVMSLLLVACFGATLVGAAEAYPFVARWFQ